MFADWNYYIMKMLGNKHGRERKKMFMKCLNNDSVHHQFILKF